MTRLGVLFRPLAINWRGDAFHSVSGSGSNPMSLGFRDPLIGVGEEGADLAEPRENKDG